MRKVMVSFLTILLSVVLAAASLTGCATGTSTAGSDSAPEVSISAAPAPEETAGSELPATSAVIYFPGDTPNDAQIVLDAINAKVKDTINAEFQFNWVPWGDYDNKITVLLASGDQYDAHFDADWGSFYPLSQKGALLDITDLFPQYAPNFYQTYDQATLDGAKVNGKLMAIPWQFPFSQRRGLFVRTDIAKKYITSDIKTFEDMDAFFQKVKENEQGLLPLLFESSDHALYYFIEAFGYVPLDLNYQLVYRWDDPEMKVMPFEQTPEYKEGIEIFNKWYENGYFAKDTLSQKEMPDYLMQTGKYASFLAVGDVNEANSTKLKNANPAFEGLTRYPLFPDTVWELSAPLNNAIVLNKNARNPERVIMFFEWVMANQENYDLLLYGIKGTHYELEGELIKMEGDMAPDDNTWFNWSGQWPFWNLDYYRAELTQPNYREKLLENVNMNTRVMPHSGFSFNVDSLKTEIANRVSNYESIGRALNHGIIGDVGIDEYIQKQKDAGADKIVAEIQRQLDEWRAANNK